MKKFLKSKGFLVTALSISCIAILAVCWFVGRDTKTVFLPDEPSRRNGRIPRILRGVPGSMQTAGFPARAVRKKNWKITQRWQRNRSRRL